MKHLRTTSRVLAATGLACLMLSSIGFGASQARATTLTAAGASSTCGPGATCETIPADCPAGTTCPDVSVEPATDLGQNQWVFVNLSNFPAGSTAYLYFCSNQTPITNTSPPYCVLQGQPDFTFPSEQLPISSDGTGETSFQTVDDPNGNGDTPLVGKIPGDPTAAPVNFFCGDAADQCSVDVVDPTLLAPGSPNPFIPVPSDTAVISLGFAPPSLGCPSATFEPTYSDDSIDWLIPHEAPIVCDGKNPVIPLNTSASTSQILPLLSSGAVVFLDDPQAADVQAALQTVHYAVIPLVASAVVMGYVAAMEGTGTDGTERGIKYPFNGMELTPNEVAGLSVFNYQGPYDADLYKCPTKGHRRQQCSALEGLNSVPGYTSAGQYGSFPASDDSSVTEELTDWMCNAPVLGLTINGVPVTDTNTAQDTLTHSANLPQPWPITACTTFDQFPALTPVGGLFDPAGDPIHAVKFLRSFAGVPTEQSAPVAGFAPIDWSDARYNGLDAASLQNADGQFVAPTAASIAAEVAAEPVSAGGYPLPDPTLSVSGGYPMSTVIDALVPDSLVPASQAAPIADMMDELLNYTTTSAILPDGFVSLPPALATLAHTELAQALAAENAGRVWSTTTTASVSPSTAEPGTSVTYSATVTAPSAIEGTPDPTGTVAFAAGSTPLCTATLSTGKASCNSTKAPAGTDTVTARYAGATGFAASTAKAVLTVTARSQPPPTTVATTTTTTIPKTVGPTGGTGTSPHTTVSTSGHTSTPTHSTKPKASKKPSRSSLSIADVTLSAAAARVVLPIALGVGGILIALSLGLSFVGVVRRRHTGAVDSG